MIAQIAFSIIGAFLSVVLTKIFIQNGRYIRQLGESMEENRKEARQLLEKITGQIGKTSQQITESQRYIAQLIAADGVKTRELIK